MSYNNTTFLTYIKAMRDAPALQKQYRKDTGDSKAIFAYYDTNQAARILHNTMTGNHGTGKCVKESAVRFVKMLPRRQATVKINMEVPKEICSRGFVFHQAIVYQDTDGEWRYETYSNGKHIDYRLTDKFKGQAWITCDIDVHTKDFNIKKFRKKMKPYKAKGWAMVRVEN